MELAAGRVEPEHRPYAFCWNHDVPVLCVTGSMVFSFWVQHQPLHLPSPEDHGWIREWPFHKLSSSHCPWYLALQFLKHKPVFYIKLFYMNRKKKLFLWIHWPLVFLTLNQNFLKAQGLEVSFYWKITWFGSLNFCSSNISCNGVWIFIALPVIYQRNIKCLSGWINRWTLRLAFNEVFCRAFWSVDWILH